MTNAKADIPFIIQYLQLPIQDTSSYLLWVYGSIARGYTHALYPTFAEDYCFGNKILGR